MQLRRTLVTLVIATATAVASLASVPGYAHAEDVTSETQFAPVDRPGPRLSVPRAERRAALTCHGDPTKGPRAILLNPATAVTPEENYGWNWVPLFNAENRYWCMVTMRYHTFDNIQRSAEMLVHAIRTMYRRTGGRIAILGHSQGGMSGRWALRFWPDTRRKVVELIGMAPSNHGTTALVQCVEGVTKCVPAVWQQADESRFVQALNSRTETFRGISYTSIYTDLDEVVTPPPSSSLTTGEGRISNIRLEDLCPVQPHEHVMMGVVSPATYALVWDALHHRGPARLERVDPAVCTQLYMPGITPTDLEANAAPLLAMPSLLSTLLPGITFSGAPMLEREPALRCYVYARTSRPQRCR